ncbi:MAG: pantoate--beta-alanine ligase [Clostridium sp.]|uniref:pantoate--beta-alanine ligase n=1 Tax=Clostridium sp. TaxID=1506 RepID=UPI003F40F573
MRILKTIKEVREVVSNYKDKKIGFVPTMGFLHEGHVSLINKARENNDVVIVSIFVNPTQFGVNEDLGSYPRDLNRDTEICKEAKADYIFCPSVREMYGENFYSTVHVDKLSEGLCGKSRPVHFDGVCLVVTKLFNIVKPNRAYFGEKDAQQLAIIKRLVKDLNIDVEIIGCPIVREEDGLAKSSRNTYLSSKERKDALVLNRGLNKSKMLLESGEKRVSILKNIIKEEIDSVDSSKIDYIEIVDKKTLEEVKGEISGDVTILVAVYIGKTRLIDNFSFGGK